ncbi:transposase and inactivated derivatives-like protein [Candidatus Vecturithrix granuli]|uniref:Transposase and inactivated derivatives-like protein n=1 Tax=Vecturithrix granuli TaxID=1499967 RepID=A0A0S6WAG3_VECG1|nr:transposase and inactivated derivatives-like protein [Candidatus Vecturithrix granuli]
MRGEPTDDQSGASAVETDAKKKSKRAEEQLRDDIKQARKEFQDAQKTLAGDDMISVDEMGGVTGISRTSGYAPCGERAMSYEPGGKGTRLSLIGALSTAGFLGGLELEGPVNGDVFEAFVEQILVPQLRPGKVVIWDNVSFHRRESLRELIEAHGATGKFLPAYSPELNPIEECWSKVKAWLRKKAAQTVLTSKVMVRFSWSIRLILHKMILENLTII